MKEFVILPIRLLKKGVSVENVYKTAGLSEEERKLKNASYWERICAAVNDKNSLMATCFRAIVNERVCEITKKLLEIRAYLDVSVDGISEAVGLPKERVEQLSQRKFTAEEVAKSMTDEYQRQREEDGLVRGEAEGKVEGLVEGKAIGEHKKALIIAKNLLEKGMSKKEVSDATDLTEEQIEQLMNNTTTQ